MTRKKRQESPTGSHKKDLFHKPKDYGFFKTLLFFTAIGLLVYSNSFHNSFHYDDFFVVVENGALRDFRDWSALFNAFNTRFLPGLSLSVNYAIGSLDPFGYHVLNVVAHILNAALVYFLAKLTLQTPALNGSALGRNRHFIGFFAGLLFLVHPLQTQAVDYIWQRNTSMAAFFYLTSMVLYAKARMEESKSYFLLSFLASFLGMFCKETAVTGPLSLVLYEFSFFESSEKPAKRILRLAPLLLLCLIIPALFTRTQTLTLDLMKPSLEVASARNPLSLDVLTRGTKESVMPRAVFLLTEINVLRTYLRLLLIPVGLNVDPDYPLSRSWLDPGTFFSFLGLLFVFTAVLLRFKKDRLLCFCVLLFFLTLSVELLVPQVDVLMEHRLYLPMGAF